MLMQQGMAAERAAAVEDAAALAAQCAQLQHENSTLQGKLQRCAGRTGGRCQAAAARTS